MNGRWPNTGIAWPAGGGQVLWTPANEPTVIAWFDETLTSSIVLSSGSVSQWTSRVGPMVLAEGTQANMPTKEAGWLRFNNQRLLGTRLAGSLFFVVRPITGSVNYGFVAGRPPGDLEPMTLSYDEAGVSFFYSYGVGMDVFREDGTAVVPPPVWESAKPTNNIRTPSASWGTPIMVGANYPVDINSQGLGGLAFSSAGSRMLLAQYVILSGHPTLGLYQQLEGWAAHAYGTTAKLPAGHPYKTVPPYV